MKKKLLKISIILTIVFFLIAVASFVIFKNIDKDDQKVDVVGYDVNYIVKEIDFLKLNTFDELKSYADENSVYIQTSDDETIFAIGELYVEKEPVNIFYKLNSDGTINRFDGTYSININDKSAQGLQEFFAGFNTVISRYFLVWQVEHSIFDADGAPIESNSPEAYELMLNGKATYGLSIIDKYNTYWYIKASVSDKKQVNFEFFRCFDLSVYGEDSPNIDLRPLEETGE